MYIYVCIKARCVCCIFLAAPIPIQRFRYLCCTRMIYGLLRYIYKGTRMHTRYTVKKTCVWCFRSWRHPVPRLSFLLQPQAPVHPFQPLRDAAGTSPPPHAAFPLSPSLRFPKASPAPDPVRESSEQPGKAPGAAQPSPCRSQPHTHPHTKRARAGKWQEPSASPCIAPSQRLV